MDLQPRDRTVDGAYLDFEIAVDLLRRSGFPYVANPVCRGSFAECMKIDVDTLVTKIPEMMGLPPCFSNNIAEGLAVRPIRRVPGPKLTLKRKSWAFLECNANERSKWLHECETNGGPGVLKGLYLSCTLLFFSKCSKLNFRIIEMLKKQFSNFRKCSKNNFRNFA